MIETLASLGAPALWTIFIVCALLMAIFPFLSKIKKAYRIKFANQKAAIHDFSWRLAPDHHVLKIKDSEYYLQSNGKQFILEGGAIILSWHVTGAYKIDIAPIGEDLIGNTAVIAAKKANNHFILTAHTLVGKLTRELTLDPALFRNIDTFNLSKDLHFKQKIHRLNTKSFSKGQWMQGKYRPGKMANLPKVATDRINATSKRYFFKKLGKRLPEFQFKSWNNSKLVMYISANKIVKALRSSNEAYNKALNK